MDPNPNHYKGYGKINGHLELEDQTPNPKPTGKSILLTISAIVVLTVTVASLLAALIHQTTTRSTTESLDSSIKLVCNVTRYPDSCFSSISSLNAHTESADPVSIFKLSLRVSIDALSGTCSSLKSNANSGPAVGDCRNLFEEALGRLNESLTAMEGEALTRTKVNDVQTWISAAVTDQETCSDGLEEMGSTLPDEVNDRLQRAKQFTSNSLAIIANIQTLSQKFHIPIP